MFENYKKILIICSIILLIFLTINSISASENIKENLIESVEIDDTDINHNTIENTEIENKKLSATNNNYKSSLKNLNKENLKASNKSVSNSKTKSVSSKKDIHDKIYKGIVISTNARYYSIIHQYSAENIVYPVKLYDIVNYDGIIYKEPKYNSVVKLRVYTGNKFKNYHGTINNTGIVSFNISNLSIGTHLVDIYYLNNKKGSSSIRIIQSKPTVYAPDTSIKYKKSNYYPIKVIDSYGNLVKNLLIKLKVYTGKKYETCTLKTNNDGVATYQTKDLKLGTHKLIINSNDKNYKISQTSRIIVKNSITPNIEPPKLKAIKYTPKDNKYSSVKLTWISKKGRLYQVIRKLNGNYRVVSNVKAKSSNTAFYDKVTNGALYTYSVRELLTVNNENIVGPYDNEGLKLINSPKVSVDFQNLKAIISWQRIDGADKYRILRKLNSTSKYKCIATVNANKLTYTEDYYKSASELSPILNRDFFVDPSFNSLHYTVSACSVKTVDSVKKTSHGLYLKDRDFKLEAPTIISLKNNKITWSEVPNAEGYLILKSNNHKNWEKIRKVKSKNTTKNSLTINKINKKSYYTVKAFATKNGATVYSDYDKDFSLKYCYKNNSKYKILNIGDSISYGSPYNINLSTPIFSIPHRISQLTGCVYYNPSIPGSSYYDSGESPKKCCICNDVVDPISKGKRPRKWKKLNIAANSNGVTKTKIRNYNIVILSAGTNDYAYNAELGSLDSDDITTFNGAINHIMDKIHDASIYRIEHGLDPIRVVFIDLFYSNRVYDKKKINNRDKTPNKIGYLLGDYQNALNQQLNKWTKSTIGTLKLYHFKTRDYNIVNSKNCPYTTQDNLHLTKFSYAQYGNIITQFIVDNIF